MIMVAFIYNSDFQSFWKKWFMISGSHSESPNNHTFPILVKLVSMQSWKPKRFLKFYDGLLEVSTIHCTKCAWDTLWTKSQKDFFKEVEKKVFSKIFEIACNSSKMLSWLFRDNFVTILKRCQSGTFEPLYGISKKLWLNAFFLNTTGKSSSILFIKWLFLNNCLNG